ncbi:MAG: zinc-ribbon domain-containing protein, partial [Methylotenera sp.]|uniref:zinc-ribbon domain-containing protein n=1 Tax=Methylotenera sp. TaxID=2051956 RepID=UPI0017A98C46|nr:zinc-ribbon domain-containing protein [Methylotenera sp.]
MVNCISCGKDIADNSKFCRFCSAPQVAKPSVPSCKKCGSVLLPNAKFCKGCGAKVEQIDNLATPTP